VKRDTDATKRTVPDDPERTIGDTVGSIQLDAFQEYLHSYTSFNGALVAWAVIVGGCQPPADSTTPGGNDDGQEWSKKVFISDLHMGDERALHGTDTRYPYGWLRANIPPVGQFLRAQLESQDVEEVVVLGDLFDGWVIPSDIVAVQN
jgi:hypothetical protein